MPCAAAARCVLVVNPEITSAHLEWKDRDCHFIFGDVCTAIVIERADTAHRGRCLGGAGHTPGDPVLQQHPQQFRFHEPQRRQRSAGARQDVPAGGAQSSAEVVPIAAAAHRGPFYAQLGHDPAGMRRFWLHQANLGMNQLVLKKLVGEASEDRAPLILNEFANTASAGSIIAFHQHRQDLVAGDLGVICSFGAGYSVGSVVVRKR